ncbi:MAG: type II toxin-antitoxin system RelE/ParE family toxin, partial [Chlamydiia bacterium]|nr:type II toxin-antitoxin system RelE/ParE family toxin [Chlamydiia bacterium]
MEEEFELEYYATLNGKSPYEDWAKTLKKRASVDYARILARLDRVAGGNLGDAKELRDGVWELRLAFGPGYRIYYGKVGNRVILLLCGGQKRGQQRDIEKAVEYWNDFQSQGRE